MTSSGLGRQRRVCFQRGRNGGTVEERAIRARNTTYHPTHIATSRKISQENDIGKLIATPTTFSFPSLFRRALATSPYLSSMSRHGCRDMQVMIAVAFHLPLPLSSSRSAREGMSCNLRRHAPPSSRQRLLMKAHLELPVIVHPPHGTAQRFESHVLVLGISRHTSCLDQVADNRPILAHRRDIDL